MSNTFRKTSIGLFAALFGVFFIAMTSLPNTPENQNKANTSENLTLAGTVIDAATDSSLTDVEVKITEIGDTFTTNKDGEFNAEGLTAGETYTITVNHDGYEEYEKQLDTNMAQSDAIEVTIKLNPVAEGQLGE